MYFIVNEILDDKSESSKIIGKKLTKPFYLKLVAKTDRVLHIHSANDLFLFVVYWINNNLYFSEDINGCKYILQIKDHHVRFIVTDANDSKKAYLMFQGILRKDLGGTKEINAGVYSFTIQKSMTIGNSWYEVITFVDYIIFTIRDTVQFMGKKVKENAYKLNDTVGGSFVIQNLQNVILRIYGPANGSGESKLWELSGKLSVVQHYGRLTTDGFV